MPILKHFVVLTDEQQQRLESLAFKGEARVSQIVTARILLKLAAKERGVSIADALDVSESLVHLLRRKFATEGLDACLTRRVQKNRCRKVTGDVEARIIAVACSTPPEGRARWTLRLLADKAVELRILDSVSHETIGQVLKKTSFSPGRRSASASRPRQTASS